MQDPAADPPVRIYCGGSILDHGKARITSDWLPFTRGTRHAPLPPDLVAPPPRDDDGFPWQVRDLREIGEWRLDAVPGNPYRLGSTTASDVAVSPDGRLVLLTSHDGASLFETATGHEIRHFPIESASVVRFIAGTTHALIGYRVINLTDGQTVRRLPVPDGVESPTARGLRLRYEQSGDAITPDVERLLATMPPPGPDDAAVRPDGTAILLIQGTVHVYHPDGRHLRHWQVTGDSPPDDPADQMVVPRESTILSLSPDGSCVAVAMAGDRRATVMAADDGRVLWHTPELDGDRIRVLALGKRAEPLLAGVQGRVYEVRADGSTRVVFESPIVSHESATPATPAAAAAAESRPAPIYGIALNPSGHQAAVTLWPRGGARIDLRDNSVAHLPVGSRVRRLSITDGGILIGGRWDQPPFVSITGRECDGLDPAGHVCAVAVASQAAVGMAMNTDGTVRMVDLVERTIMHTVDHPRGRFNRVGLAVSPDGRIGWTATHQTGEIRLEAWSLVTGMHVRTVIAAGVQERDHIETMRTSEDGLEAWLVLKRDDPEHPYVQRALRIDGKEVDQPGHIAPDAIRGLGPLSNGRWRQRGPDRLTVASFTDDGLALAGTMRGALLIYRKT